MRIALVDDDRLITAALTTILGADPELHVVASGSDGADAVRICREEKPDVLVMDIRMEGMNGLDALSEILREDKTQRVLLLTTFTDDEYIIKAIRAGAKGYMLKQDYTALTAAIKAVYSGQSVFGEEITAKIPELITSNPGKPTDPEADSLTEREADVASLIAEGLSNKEIGEKLFLSEGTVRNYLSSVLDKLDLRDRTQLAIYCLTGKK